MKQKTALTDAQVQSIEAMSQVGIPITTMSVILGVSKATFERLVKRDKRVKEALERGRARASVKAHQTAFQLATGYKRTFEVERYNKFTKQMEKRIVTEDVPPSEKMLQFWLRTREGWKDTARVEITSPGGSENTIDSMTPAQRVARLEELRALRERFAQIPSIPKLIGSDIPGEDPDAES